MESILGFGSNLGDRLKNLNLAIDNIKRLINTEVLEISKIYETEPFDVLDEQNCYLNCCVKIKTDFTPEVLLGCCLGIEAAMGRTRPFFHASRIIDIDLIMCQNMKINTQHLVLPHPRMFERAFVLIPLLDVYHGTSVSLIQEKLKNLDTKSVKLYEGEKF